MEIASRLEIWIIQAPASALGPLLYTLVAPPQAFIVAHNFSKDGRASYSSVESHFLQQQAIALIVNTIANGDSTRKTSRSQFVQSCARMNLYGSLAGDDVRAYCENRLRIDAFMRVAVQQITYEKGKVMRSEYLETARALGAEMDRRCEELLR